MIIENLHKHNTTIWNTPELKAYKTIKDEITVHNDVLSGHRIILPDVLRDKAIDVAHKGHQGICKTQNLLRSKVWFPNLDGLTEEKIKSCLACQATSSLLIDEYSRYPIVDITSSTNFHNLKTILEKTFTTFGIPEQLKS
ncbi:Integrase zinc binding domain [Popillia japonica]|uniref:RNA-directed DNA polymerase n=1 Tax=Popillia japonica TaxID=7064 RepID=A0AAW1HWT3_POPJA